MNVQADTEVKRVGLQLCLEHTDSLSESMSDVNNTSGLYRWHVGEQRTGCVRHMHLVARPFGVLSLQGRAHFAVLQKPLFGAATASALLLWILGRHTAYRAGEGQWRGARWRINFRFAFPNGE